MGKLRSFITAKRGQAELQQEPDNSSNFIPASNGESMQPFINWVKTFSDLRPKNIFEIGANMAQDAEALRNGFGLKPKDVWVFEPHPELYKFIKSQYQFNVYDLAILDKGGSITINAINPFKNSNSGISSVRMHKDVPTDHFTQVKVQSTRMDSFMRQHKIKSIDFLKLDVEGCDYEVLDGFGEMLGAVKCMHIEAEHYEHWEGEKLWEDIKAKLEPGFEMVFFERHFTQSDSFWVNKKFFKAKP